MRWLLLAAAAAAEAQCAADGTCTADVDAKAEVEAAGAGAQPGRPPQPGEFKKFKKSKEWKNAKKAGAEGMPWVPRANDDESDADPLTEDELQNAEKAAAARGEASEEKCRAIARNHVAGGEEKCGRCMPAAGEGAEQRLVNASNMDFDLADAGRCYYTKSRSHAYCLPSVIILGAMKAGTTELITWMQKHPAVQASRHELEFFSNDFIYNGEGTHAEVIRAYPMGVKSFRMSRAEVKSGRVILESSPEYMYTRPVPRRVLDFLPNARLIALLRKPADRMYSHFQMDCAHQATASFRYVNGRVKYFARMRPDPTLPAYMNRWPTPQVLRYEKAACNETDFHDWVEQLVETKQREPMPGLTIKQFFQIAASQYHLQLKLWNNLFPCRVFVATSDDMKQDMADATNRIYTWLGMNEFDYTDHIEKDSRGFWMLKGEWSKARGRQYAKLLPETEKLLNEHFFKETIATLKEQYPNLPGLQTW